MFTLSLETRFPRFSEHTYTNGELDLYLTDSVYVASHVG